MNVNADRRRSLGTLRTPPLHRSSFIPRSALSLPQPPPLYPGARPNLSILRNAPPLLPDPARFFESLHDVLQAVRKLLVRSQAHAQSDPQHRELRIDVNQPAEDIETELAVLHRRLQSPGGPLNSCNRLPTLLPGLIFHHQQRPSPRTGRRDSGRQRHRPIPDVTACKCGANPAPHSGSAGTWRAMAHHCQPSASLRSSTAMSVLKSPLDAKTRPTAKSR